MKHLIYSLMLSMIFISCEKDTTENTVKPPVVNYPYDSIHKKLIGDWVERYPNGSGGMDTVYLYRITYDSVLYKLHPKYSTTDSIYRVKFISYKLRSMDSIFCRQLYFGINGYEYKDYFQIIKFYNQDSILFKQFHVSNSPGQGFITDGLLVR